MHVYESAHDISVHLVHAQTQSLNVIPDISSWDRGLSICPSLHLHPYFVYASSGCSGEFAYLQRHARVFIA